MNQHVFNSQEKYLYDKSVTEYYCDASNVQRVTTDTYL